MTEGLLTVTKVKFDKKMHRNSKIILILEYS